MTALVPEDAALFGRLNAQLVDEWADLLEQALRQGIASLPLMQQDAQKNLMDKILRPKYWRNIDIAELYAARNIFTLAMFPPKRRARIVQACLHHDVQNNDTPLQDVTTLKANQDDIKDDDNGATTTTSSITANAMIISESIPTAQQLEELNQEGQALRQRLQQAKRRRAQAQQALQQATKAAKLAQQAEEITGEVEAEKTQVVQAVTETMVGAQGLAEVKAVGEKLVKNMDEKKQNRGDEDEDDIVVLAARPPKKLKTLQEQYQEDQKVVGAVEQLQQVQRLLQQKDE